MNLHSKPAGKPAVGDMAALGLMGALMFAAKLALASIPNVHLTAVFIIIAAIYFGWRAMYCVAIYVLLEGLIYGFGIWWISYLYAWPLLCAAAVLFRRNDSAIIWAVIAGVHGLCFGALCALPYILISGTQAAIAYWIAGIPFDLVHCASNFVLTLVLVRPLGKVMQSFFPRETSQCKGALRDNLPS